VGETHMLENQSTVTSSRTGVLYINIQAIGPEAIPKKDNKKF
jgi:hypothetical protein